MKLIATYFLTVLLLGLAGCKTHCFRPNLSREAYQAFVKKCADLGIPTQPYEDWALFQSQNDLHQLYWAQLDIDLTDNMNDHPFEITFECWGDFHLAEQAFRNRAILNGVQPADAFKTYELSNRHRRVIGQYECRIGVQAEHKDSFRVTAQKPEHLIKLQQAAQDQLTHLDNDLKNAPYTSKLHSLALEELANSDRMWIEGDESSAFQWARDAKVTAESANALYKLESRTP